MGREFEIAREIEVPGTPEQTWAAITTGTGGWLWPMEVEPRVGGAAPWGGTVLAWDPPHRFVVRAEGEDGFFNQLDQTIDIREGGGTFLRYVHSGVLTDDWDNQYDGANWHTDFYLHTLTQYLAWFTGRPAAYASVEGPEAAKRPGSLDRARAALGIPAQATVGDQVRLAPTGLDPLDAVVDYRNEHFIGLRTGDALYRFFGREAWGAMPVGISIHHFGDADPKELEQSWQRWLNEIYS
jgi:hypothetical protein